MEYNAVQIQNLSFKYNKLNILHDIYMNVPKCCIYALLGPSGSGKTTLLRLLLGRVKPEYGTITIFGNNKPGHFNRIIGYMPQSQALSPELTIGETIDYFASLYQLPQNKFIQIKNHLKRIFCIAEDEQIVSTLSGGQQKALSLALVFLHSPKLVFLDEPTVGTDPLLGDQIWSYLRSNLSNGLTVIIVTHYIQEASLADRIGMMRNGRMIEEGVPKMLYCKYNETNLETIFIKICTEKSENDINKKVQSYQNKIVSFLSYSSTENVLVYKKKSIPMEYIDQNIQTTIYSLFWLLFILVRRNIHKFLNSKLTSIMLFSPVYCTLLMCITFKVDKIMLPTAVFNEEISPFYSNRFQATVTNFSVHHIQYLPFNSLEEAISAVEKGNAIAALWFEVNFTSAIIKRALALVNEESSVTSEDTIKSIGINSYHTDISHDETNITKDSGPHDISTVFDYEYEDDKDEVAISNETLKASTIKVFIDNSNMFHAQPIMDLLNYGTWDLFNQVVKDQGHLIATSPVHVQEIIYAEGTEAPDFLLSGYMIGFLYLSQVVLTSQLLIMERNEGFFDRAIVAGAKHSLMFFSHFITNILFSLIQIILMSLIGFLWYRIPNFGSYWLIFLLVFLQSTSSIMTGLLISAICEVNFSAFFIALSVTLSQLFTSGALFPIISFDPTIKFILNITPIAMPVESLRNVMLRGWDIYNFNVLHGLIANLTTTILFGSLALYFFKTKS